MKEHYNKNYWKFQETIGKAGGPVNAEKFRQDIQPTDDVIDFGCGGGYILCAINCRGKYGIEVNPNAAAVSKANGLTMFQSVKDAPDECADVLISHHALEHVPDPLQVLVDLRRVLRPQGKAVIVVPCESIKRSYRPLDINCHLYTWSPMCLGNLLTAAGYKVQESKALDSRWPPGFSVALRLLTPKTCAMLASLYGRLARSLLQVRAVATR